MGVVYQSERATVIQGDAREELAQLGTETLDLVVVDPPYGVEWQSNLRTERFEMLHEDGAGDRDKVAEVLRECVRVVGQSRHLYVFGPTDVLEGLKVSAPAPLVWDKGTNGAGSMTSPWAPIHEPISFLISRHRHGGKAGQDGGVPARLRRGSILRYMRPTGRKVRHPSEKPWELMAELIESSSRPGEWVLDPCAGTGATGVAAILRGRKTLLIESHAGYAELAAQRVRRAEEFMDAFGTNDSTIRVAA